MNSPLVLIRLPPELIARIVDDPALQKQDLMRLRLACKSVNPWATKSLAKQHLSKIGISLTRHDLQALSEISKHPQFGPHIRSIQLDHTRVHPDYIAILADAMVRAKQSGDDDFSKTKERFQGSSRRFIDELELEDSEEALQSLNVAFSALKAYDRPITLTSADTYRMGCDFGHERITKFIRPYEQQEPRCTHLNSTMRVLLQAASLSGLHVDCFQFSYYKPREWQFPAQSAPYIDIKICSELETLKIEFESPLDRLETLPLKQFLAAATHVKVFELNLLAEPDLRDCISIRETQFCQEILESIVPDSLTSVKLWNLGISQKVLSMFLNKHRHTLKSLKIFGSAVFEGSWRKVFAWIRNKLTSLQELHLRLLYETQDEDEYGEIATQELFADKRDWELIIKGNNTHIRDEITKLLMDTMI